MCVNFRDRRSRDRKKQNRKKSHDPLNPPQKKQEKTAIFGSKIYQLAYIIQRLLSAKLQLGHNMDAYEGLSTQVWVRPVT